MSKTTQLQWTITNSRLDDTESMAAMHNQSWLDTYPGIQPGMTKEWVENWVAGRANPEGLKKRQSYIQEAIDNPGKKLYLSAKDLSGEVIGFLSGMKGEAQQLTGLYIDKRYYGSGLAQEMAQKFFEWADSAVATKVSLATNNNRAKRFYEKLGFVEVPDSEHIFADTVTEIDMMRPAEKQ